MPVYTLNVNNKNYTVDVDQQMPLLWVIRDFVGYSAVVVHINGYAVLFTERQNWQRHKLNSIASVQVCDANKA